MSEQKVNNPVTTSQIQNDASSGSAIASCKGQVIYVAPDFDDAMEISEQKAVPEIPEDLREMYESSKLDTTMFVGSQIRQLIRRITNLEAELAELRATDHTVQMEETADAKAERKKYEALREENAALKATVERLSAPVSDEDHCEGCDKVLAEDEGQSDHGGDLLCAECWQECANDPACHEDECECSLCKPAPAPRHRWVHHCPYDEQQCDAECRRVPTTVVCSKCGVRKSNLPAKCAARTTPPAKEPK